MPPGTVVSGVGSAPRVGSWSSPVVALAAALVAVPVLAQSPSVPVRSALEPATTGGIEVVDRALAKLTTHSRLLVIGAHPDDEDTSMLTLVSRGLGGEAAYLSLSRGEGGQNLIGIELGEGLGVLRTQELLAARRIDGAHQFFTRAFDFGYTRSLDETLRRWPREVLLEDVARVVWRFRPQVIVAMFSREIGGHGQHLASGWAAEEVFPLAGSAHAFPRLVAEGWLPWQPASLYRRAWFDPENASFEVSLGRVEALSGRSMLQIAMASRSQHRSQDMGMLQPLGSRAAGLALVARSGGPDDVPSESVDAGSLFDGVDTRLEAIASTVSDEEARREVSDALREAARLAGAARVGLSPARLADAVQPLATVLDALHRAHAAVADSPEPGARIAAELVWEKIEIARAGLAAAAGVGIEAVSDREAVAPGEAAEIVASVWNSGGEAVETLAVELSGSDAWRVESREIDPASASVWELDGTSGSGVVQWGFTARLRPEAEPSRPYFLAAPRQGDLYDWSRVAPELRGLPYQEPELVARFRLSIAGREVELAREVVRRLRDQALGEVRRPLRAVPAVEVAVAPATLLWDADDRSARSARVTLSSHLGAPVAGEVVPATPPGWAVSAAPFSVPEAGGEAGVELAIEPTREVEPGRHELAFAARITGDREVVGSGDGWSYPVLEYPHIRPTPLPVAATLEVSALDLELPDVGPIGYVRGASDRLPELLAEVGLAVELLDEEELARGDLSRFRVIVVGSRAYETDPALAAANSRLLDFVHRGGLLVVQYQQYQFARGGFAPYALEIDRPHDRITDETAAVELLDPSHPVFTTPNELTDADWSGWVQERGLYFAGSWGEEFTPLLSMADPGLEAERGGLLVARLGEGLYVYTGLAFFRQLPAGVPGGYRLFLNLLALE